MYTNRLADEKSPYLLQHAHNPVDWYAWGEAAFEKARSEDKPIFLSIGYSTCHWCHVMERESFESEEVAAVLNRYFVPVKVDREERPDVDRIYMTFVQSTTGSGGWPMSVWLTPDRKPFHGGTYFPPDNRYGRPGFRTLLEYIAQAWSGDRAKILQSSEEILEELRKNAEVKPGAIDYLDDSMIDTCFNVLRRNYDSALGGFGQAPKFPRPVVHHFLFRYGKHDANEMALHTLREMAKGGMNDQLGGGFHRYSVDERWFVPHFEKMLYDQAQLAASYVEAFQITKDQQYAGVAREIFDYVLRDMTHPEGGFYSAEDADSVIDPSNPREKGEGAFYIWHQGELDVLLGQPSAEWFSYRYGVKPNGNVENDPHGEFTGRNILYQAHTVEETARNFGAGESEVGLAMAAAQSKLMEARGKRVRPHLDDKILSGWNGMMISAFALGAQALDEPRYAEAARRAADFVLNKMRAGVLLRRFRDGGAAIPGFLDDYVCFANALVDLYETTFEASYLQIAEQLAREMIARFEDPASGGFFSTSGDDSSLVIRMKEDYDGAEPSGNSVALCVLLRLAALGGGGEFRKAAGRALHAFAPRLRAAPHALPQMLAGYMQFSRKSRQIVLAGTDLAGMLRAIRTRFLPYTSVLQNRDAMPAIDGKATAYVCEDFTCHLPVTNVDDLVQLLQ
jgi:hypothetical protein